MLRYLVIATVIVFVVGGIVAAIHRRGGTIRVASVQSTGSPSPPRRQASSTLSPRPVRGNAPWALSAVPECFHQESEARGPLSFAAAHVPAGATSLQAGALIRVADCAVEVRAGSVLLARGAERLRVPHAALYRLRADTGLALLHRETQQAVLRVYRPVGSMHVKAAPLRLPSPSG